MGNIIVTNKIVNTMGACTAGLRGCCGHDARFGEYEFSEIGSDPNSRLTLTNKLGNNAALVKHIKTAASKICLASADSLDLKGKVLEQASHYAPTLRLKVPRQKNFIGHYRTFATWQRAEYNSPRV